MGLSLRDPVLEILAEKKDHYPYEAYEFISTLIKVLDNEMEAVASADQQPNITATQLCERSVSVACGVFGRMARAVFNTWKIHTTRDIGEIVFHLMEAEVVGAADGDKIEDFDDLFRVDLALDKPVAYFTENELP